MRKSIYMALFCLLGACAPVQDETALKTCLTEQAIELVASGKATASPVRLTVKKMLTACEVQDQTPEVKRLAQEILNIELNK